MTASWQKIFSADPEARATGSSTASARPRRKPARLCLTAKTPDDVDAVIRNTFIQGTLSIVFAVLVVIVFVAGVIVALRAIRGDGSPLTEDEPVPSRLFAPSGLIPTNAEREVQKQWDALPKSHARSVGTGAH